MLKNCKSADIKRRIFCSVVEKPYFCSMEIDELFTTEETTAAERLQAATETDPEVSGSRTTLMLRVDADFTTWSKDLTADDKSRLTRYIRETVESIRMTVAASRSAELTQRGVEIATDDHILFVWIRDDLGYDYDAVWDPHEAGRLYFRISICEDFRHPVQLVRFVSELFENTRNRQYYDYDRTREIRIVRATDATNLGIYVQDAGFKDLITEKRHEKKLSRRRFSERETFKKICKICYYVMQDRRTGTDIYRDVCKAFHGNFDIELMYAAECALQHDEPQDKWFHVSDISAIASTPVMTGFDFLNASINLRDFDHRTWWQIAGFVFQSTYKEQQYYHFYDFDSSGRLTEYGERLAEQCKQFYDFRFPFFRSIFKAGFMWDTTLNDYHFVMIVKLGPVACPVINSGAPYETAFVYKERIKQPDAQLTPMHYANMICNALHSEYIDNHFRTEVRLLLENNLKKILDGNVQHR